MNARRRPAPMPARALVALAALTLGIGGALAADAEVSLVLFDGQRPLPQAEVRIDGRPRAKTNADGVAVLELAPGTHTLSVVRADHTVLTVELMLRADENAEIIATLYEDAAPSILIESSHGAAAPAAAGAAQAGGPPGVLEGQVLSAENGQPVAGARVYISGTPLDISTDTQGRWRAELPPGEYSLSVIAARYATRTVDALAVRSEHTAVRDIELTPAGMELPEFVVLEPFVEGSLAAFVEEKRTSAAVTDILGAEQISRQGDSDAAGALRRVTGLTLVDGKYVYVRGLGERYSSVLLNGAQIPSPDPTRRVIPLDLFPTDVLSGVVIQKTYSAEMPGEFGGGIVQLRTKGIPDAAFLKLGLTTGYAKGTSFQDGIGYDGGGRDYTGFDDGSRALPDSIAEVIAGGRFLRARNPTNPDGLTSEQLERLGEDLAAGGYGVRERRIGPDLGASVSGGNAFALGEHGRWGFLAALRYSNQWDSREEQRRTFRATGTGELRVADDDRVTETLRNVDVSGFVNLGLELADAHALTLTSMLLHQAEDSTRFADGQEDSQLRQTYELKWVESELLSNQLRGEHALPWWDLAADWQYTGARATREEPNTRQYRRDDDDSNGTYIFSDRNSSNSQSFGELVDDSVSWDLAVQLPLQLGERSALTLRGGVGRVERDREAAIRRFSFGVGRGIPRDDFELPQEELLSPPYIGPDGFTLVETTLGTDNYTASQRMAARYLTADLGAGERWRLIGGLREEDNFQQVLTRSVSNPDQVIPAQIEQRDRLPALALTWAYGANAQLRAGYGRSLSRPDFRELSPAQFEDPLLDLVTVGNPDLKTTQIENYDLRWEYYFSPTESFSVAAFFKDFSNPIEKTFSSGGSAKIINLQNALAAEVYGIEFDLYRQLGFIGELGFVRGSFLDRIDWGSYHIGANYARIESAVEIDTALTIQTNSDRPLQGQSPYVANLQLGYTDPGGGSEWTLLYNVFGERIAQAGVAQQPDIYEQPFPQLDLVYRRPFGEHWDFKLRLRNLLDPEVEFTQGDRTTRSYRRGRELALTIEWKPF